MPRAPRHLALVVVALCLLAGCTDGTAACPSPNVTVEATVTDDGMDPSAIAVCRGQEVTLEVNSQTDAVLHLHGFDDQVPATSLTPGETRTLVFTADVAGQFIIELHDGSGASSAEIGVLTVNEP
jgi:hypothetical protein